MNKIAAITFIVILLMYPFHSEARDNPFVSKKAPKKEVTLPAFASKCFAKIALWQHQLNEKLTEHVKRLKANKTWDTLLPLILISFLYGIIHAAGPGHGKVVVFSYFFSHRSSVKKGLLLGNLISLFHAASGVTIVLDHAVCPLLQSAVHRPDDVSHHGSRHGRHHLRCRPHEYSGAGRPTEELFQESKGAKFHSKGINRFRFSAHSRLWRHTPHWNPIGLLSNPVCEKIFSERQLLKSEENPLKTE